VSELTNDHLAGNMDGSFVSSLVGTPLRGLDLLLPQEKITFSSLWRSVFLGWDMILLDEEIKKAFPTN